MPQSRGVVQSLTHAGHFEIAYVSHGFHCLLPRGCAILPWRTLLRGAEVETMRTLNRKLHVYRSLRLIFVIILVLASNSLLYAQSQPVAQSVPEARQKIAVRGKVIDSKTGEGIAKALVSIRQQSLETVTDATGAFNFPEVVPGDIVLYVSTVGYQLLKSPLHIGGDRDVEAEIYLGQQAVQAKRNDHGHCRSL